MRLVCKGTYCHLHAGTTLDGCQAVYANPHSRATASWWHWLEPAERNATKQALRHIDEVNLCQTCLSWTAASPPHERRNSTASAACKWHSQRIQR